MDYIEVKVIDLEIGQVYTDLKPDSKPIEPMYFILIEKNYKEIGFKKLGKNTNGYIESKNGLIYFSANLFNKFYKPLPPPRPRPFV